MQQHVTLPYPKLIFSVCLSVYLALFLSLTDCMPHTASLSSERRCCCIAVGTEQLQHDVLAYTPKYSIAYIPRGHFPRSIILDYIVARILAMILAASSSATRARLPRDLLATSPRGCDGTGDAVR